MAVTVLSNKKNKSVTLHVAGANATLVIAGNSAVSNVATSDEVLTGAVINQVIWGIDTGSVQIARGSNAVGTFTQSNHINYGAAGLPLSKDSSANLTINFVGSANGYCIVELKKLGGGTSEYFQV